MNGTGAIEASHHKANSEFWVDNNKVSELLHFQKGFDNQLLAAIKHQRSTQLDDEEEHEPMKKGNVKFWAPDASKVITQYISKIIQASFSNFFTLMNQPFHSTKWDRTKRTVDHLTDPAYNNMFSHKNNETPEEIIKPYEDILLDAPALDQQLQLCQDNDIDMIYSSHNNDLNNFSEDEDISKIDTRTFVSSEVKPSPSTKTLSHDLQNLHCLCSNLHEKFYKLKQIISTSTKDSDDIATTREEVRTLYEQQFSDTTDVWSDVLMATITDRDLLCIHCAHNKSGLTIQNNIRRRKKYNKLFLKTSTTQINNKEQDDDGKNSPTTTLMSEDG